MDKFHLKYRERHLAVANVRPWILEVFRTIRIREILMVYKDIEDYRAGREAA